MGEVSGSQGPVAETGAAVAGAAPVMPGETPTVLQTLRRITAASPGKDLVESMFSAAFNAAKAGMALILPSGDYLAVNDAFCEITGYDRGELLGLDWRDLTHPEDLEINEQQSSALLEGVGGHDSHFVSKRYIRKDDSVIDVEITDAVVRSPEGEPLYFVTQVVDVTNRNRTERERMMLEERLAQTEKMEALGQVAGGVAHDFNNSLTVIGNCARFVLQAMDADDPHRRDVLDIIAATEKSRLLTSQLLTFAHKQSSSPVALDVVEAVHRTKTMLERALREDIELAFETPPNRVIVRMDAGQFEQVLLNLAANARDAMPDGGTLTVSLVEQPALGEVTISFKDSGQGISEDALPRVFEPFFTTKPPGAGTGLGLATVQGIVDRAGGSVTIDSTEGQGTTISVRLPTLVPNGVATYPVDERAAATRRSGRILVVEDDDQVRRVIRRILSRCGYEVLTAESGQHALEIISKAPDSIKLIICDVVMPGMSGRRLMENLTEQAIRIPILFMSGYTNEFPDGSGGPAVIQKPFDEDRLLAAIDAALSAS